MQNEERPLAIATIVAALENQCNQLEDAIAELLAVTERTRRELFEHKLKMTQVLSSIAERLEALEQRK